MTDNSGKMVTIAYTGRLDNGWEFMSVPPEAPIRFPCTPGWMPPEIVEAVRTMEVGETRIAHVGADMAYEKWTEERLIHVPKERVKEMGTLKLGDVVHLQDPTGKEFPARLISLEEEAVFDANDEAVAQGMHFEITLLAVKEMPSKHPR